MRTRYRITITEIGRPAAPTHTTTVWRDDDEDVKTALIRAVRRFYGRSAGLDLDRTKIGESSAYGNITRPTYYGRGANREFAGHSVEQRLQIEWEAV